jgi:hypothetical protein
MQVLTASIAEFVIIDLIVILAAAFLGLLILRNLRRKRYARRTGNMLAFAVFILANIVVIAILRLLRGRRLS